MSFQVTFQTSPSAARSWLCRRAKAPTRATNHARQLLMVKFACSQAGGSAFSVLFKGAGSSAVDDIIPSLLNGLDGTERQAAQV